MAGTAAEQAIKEVQRMEALKKKLVAQKPTTNTGPKSERRLLALEAEIKQIDDRIAQLRTTSQRCVAPSNLVNRNNLRKAGETAVAVGENLIERYLRAYGTIWKGDILPIENCEKFIPLISGIAGVDVGVVGGIGAEVAAERHNHGLKCKGSVKGELEPFFGIGVGVSIPVLGELKLTGGIQGGAKAEGTVEIILEIAGGGLKAGITPFTFNIDMVAKVYIHVPGIPEKVLKNLKMISSKIDVANERVTYELGSLNILTIITPSYSLTFTLTQGKYVYNSSSGKYSITLNPKVKRAVTDMIDSIKQAASKALSALNPFD